MVSIKIVTGASFDGTETYLYTEVVKAIRGYPRELYWTASSTTTLTDCTDCLFTFTIDFIFDTSNSVIDTTSSDCVDYAATYSFDYGYIEDYDGAGNAGLVSRNTGTTTGLNGLPKEICMVDQQPPLT